MIVNNKQHLSFAIGRCSNQVEQQEATTAAISTSGAFQSNGSIGLIAMGVLNEEPTVVKDDNQSCIKVYKNPVMQNKSKHIDLK